MIKTITTAAAAVARTHPQHATIKKEEKRVAISLQ